MVWPIIMAQYGSNAMDAARASQLGITSASVPVYLVQGLRAERAFCLAKKREVIRTARPDPSLAKKRAAQDDKAN
jgi:hypothetical protein